MIHHRLQKWHWITGLIISFFFLLHVSNHLAALWGVEAHLQFNNAVRKLYRNLIVETILLAAVCTQVYSGIKLAIGLRKEKKAGFEKLRVYSGLYLAFFLIAHTAAVFIFRSNGVNTNFYFGVLGFIIYPATFVFIPYYSLGVLSVFLHIAATHYFKIQRFVAAPKARQHAWCIIALGLLVTSLIIYGFVNAMDGRPVPPEYLKLAR